MPWPDASSLTSIQNFTSAWKGLSEPTELYLFGHPCKWTFATLCLSATSVLPTSHILSAESRGLGERSHVPHAWLHVTGDEREAESKWSALTAGVHVTCSTLLAESQQTIKHNLSTSFFFFFFVTVPLPLLRQLSVYNNLWKAICEFNSLFWSKEFVPHETLSLTVHAALLYLLYLHPRLTPSYHLTVKPCSSLADGHT